MISPTAAVVKAVRPSVTRKASEIVRVSTNSATLTVPMVVRGSVPWISRLEETIEASAAAAARRPGSPGRDPSGAPLLARRAGKPLRMRQARQPR